MEKKRSLTDPRKIERDTHARKSKGEQYFCKKRFNDLNELNSCAQAWIAQTWPLRYCFHVSHQPAEADEPVDGSKKFIELNGCDICYTSDGTNKIPCDVEVLKIVNCNVDLGEEDEFFSRFIIPMELNIFCSLCRIKIIKCQNIKKLFSSRWVLSNFQLLMELYVEDCDSVEDIMASETSEMQEKGISAFKFTLPRLRSLVLRGLPELKSICGENGVLVCYMIKLIDIRNCPKLKKIPLNLPLHKLLDDHVKPCPPPFLNQIVIVPPEQWSQLKWDHPKAKSVLQPYVVNFDAGSNSLMLEEVSNPLFQDCFLESNISIVEKKAEPNIAIVEEKARLSKSESFQAQPWFPDLKSYAQALQAQKMGPLQNQIYVGRRQPAAPDESNINETEKLIELNQCDICTEGVMILSDVEALNIVDCIVDLCEDNDDENKVEAFFSRFVMIPVPHSSIFSSLSRIQIISCQNIKKLFSSNWELHLQNLVKLRVEDCNSMEDIIASEPELKEEGKSASTFVLPKLHSLVLRNLPKLKSIYGANGVMVCDSVEDIVMHDCPKLKRMLSICATYNEPLRTAAANDESCKESEKFVEVNGCNIYAGGIKMLSDVGKLHIFKCTVDLCEEKEAFFPRFITPVPHSIFSILSRIEIIDCKNIKKLFLSNWVKHNLQNLKILCVRGCKEMEEIIAAESELLEEGTRTIKFALPKLRWLELYDLPELKSICSAGGVIVCNSIEKIFIGNCPNIKRIPLNLPQCDDGQPSPPPCLVTINAYPEEWWEMVKWDHPNAKSLLQPYVENWPVL